MKIGVISIAPTIRRPAEMEFSQFFAAIGQNSGNYLFTTAAYRQLEGEVSHIGFHFDPQVVNNEFDCVVVPAANWLRASINWDWFIDLLSKLEVPIITIGIGLQADVALPDRFRMSESSERLVRLLASRAPYISTRGNFTTSVLQSMGILNVVATGCPSIYLKLDAALDGITQGGKGLVVQSTRYELSETFLASRGPNRNLFTLAGSLNCEMIYQSEMEEIEFLICGESAKMIHNSRSAKLKELYGFETHADLLMYLRERGRFFIDVSEWSKHIRRFDMHIGTRLHGALVALNSGVPAIMIGHDSRTSEMIEFARIPTVPLNLDIASLDDAKIAALITSEAIQEYREARRFNGKIYRAFLAANGLTPREEAFLS